MTKKKTEHGLPPDKVIEVLGASLKLNWRAGVQAAAHIADEYNGSTTHDYRLGDCILGKLNAVARAKPRKNERRIQDPKEAWLHGFAVALAEVHRLSGNSSGIVEAARVAQLTLAEAKKAGTDPYDLRELRRAGIK